MGSIMPRCYPEPPERAMARLSWYCRPIPRPNTFVTLSNLGVGLLLLRLSDLLTDGLLARFGPVDSRT